MSNVHNPRMQDRKSLGHAKHISHRFFLRLPTLEEISFKLIVDTFPPKRLLSARSHRLVLGRAINR
jgi:hypothetical protein